MSLVSWKGWGFRFKPPLLLFLLSHPVYCCKAFHTLEPHAFRNFWWMFDGQRFGSQGVSEHFGKINRVTALGGGGVAALLNSD